MIWTGYICYWCGRKIMARDVSDQFPHLIANVYADPQPCDHGAASEHQTHEEEA